MYTCGKDLNRKCFKNWSKCVKNGFGKMVSLMFLCVHMWYIMCTIAMAHGG